MGEKVGIEAQCGEEKGRDRSSVWGRKKVGIEAQCGEEKSRGKKERLSVWKEKGRDLVWGRKRKK